MKKIYITGIAGLLGNNIVMELKDRFVITGADIVDVEMPEIEYECIDLCDYDKLRGSIERCRPDVVVHTVAVVNVDFCEINKVYAKKINVELTSSIQKICRDLQIKMIYISSDAVFDGCSEHLYREEEDTNPLNYYAETKYYGEIETLKSPCNLVLRTNIFGLNIQDKNSFGEWILKTLLDDGELNMFEDIFFSPILVNELAHIIANCIDADLSNVYHACGTGAISKYEFAIYLKEKFGIQTGRINKTNSSSAQFLAKRPKHMGLSNQKIKDELGITISDAYQSIDSFYELCKKKGVIAND